MRSTSPISIWCHLYLRRDGSVRDCFAGRGGGGDELYSLQRIPDPKIAQVGSADPGILKPAEEKQQMLVHRHAMARTSRRSMFDVEALPRVSGDVEAPLLRGELACITVERESSLRDRGSDGRRIGSAQLKGEGFSSELNRRPPWPNTASYSFHPCYSFHFLQEPFLDLQNSPPNSHSFPPPAGDAAIWCAERGPGAVGDEKRFHSSFSGV